ncbi:MAG: hypothetical protein Q8R78_05835 [Candidatus Omnitrophota bacterium]|nr:hypothetical protein [Candidatus Omnitrophota bacterium]
MTAHTPLPWKRAGVFESGGGWAEFIIGPCTSADPTRIVCVLEDERMGKAMMEATADFIVRACNTHADLVAALESIAKNTCCNRCQEAALVARTALAKAQP